MNEEESLWFKKYGFFSNPFSIKPAPFDFKVIGQDKILEDLYYKIPNGNMTFIEGKFGNGKSTILKHLINKFKGERKVIYFACNRIDKDLDIEKLLMGKYGFWGRMFKLHPKDMIVLLDESQDLTPENTQRIKYFFDQGNIKTVVFTGVSYERCNLHESIKDRIGKDVLKLRELNDDEAILLIRNRIGETNLMSDEIVKKLWKLSNKNPRRLLQYSDMVCRKVVETDEKEVTDKVIKEVLKPEK